VLGDEEIVVPKVESPRPWRSNVWSVKGSEGANCEESDDSSAGVDRSLARNDPALEESASGSSDMLGCSRGMAESELPSRASTE